MLKKGVSEKTAGVVLIVYALVVTFLHLYRPGEQYYFLIVDIAQLFILPLGVFFAWINVKEFGHKSILGKTSLFLGLALFSYWIGDIFWTFLAFESLQTPGDIFFLLFYPLIGIGVYYGASGSDLFKNKTKTVVFALLTVVSAIVYFTLIPIKWDTSLSFIENFVTTGWIIADMVLIVVVLAIIIALSRGMFKLPWIYVSLGLICILFADVYYAHMFETYESGDLIDLAWYYGYFLIGYALVKIRTCAEKLLEK